LKFEWRRSSPDRNDRVEKEEDGTTTTQFFHDGLNPIQESNSSTGVANLLTGLRVGRRMSKTVSGTTTQYLYDRLNPVQELNGTGGVVANLLTGLRIDEYFTRTDNSNNVSTFVADALGSTIGLVGSAQAIASNYTYQPFGATTSGGTTNGNLYEFTGRENDATGLYFYRARYYSPTFQRFIAQDPMDFLAGNLNLYGYASNNPTNFRDPLGLWVFGIGLNGGAGVGGAGGSWTRELVFDSEGGVGIATTTCGGGIATVASAGVGGAVSYNPNLSSISDLSGSSLEVGSAFPAGEGVGAGFSFTFQNKSCGKSSVGVNAYFGAAAGFPPGVPITPSGMGCHTRVQPISWTISGLSGSEVPSLP